MIRQFLSGTKAVLLNQPIVNGQILFPNDASEIYYDMNGTRRGVTGVSYVRYDSDLTGIVNPEEKLYFSLDSRRMFAYDASTQEFIQVNRTGVVTNLTSAQRISLESCAEDCIYIDSDTMEAYVGVNLGSNSVSSSLFGSVLWRRVGESISNYNGQVNVRTNDKNVISTDQDGNISIGSNSTGVNVLTSDLKLNGNSTNTSGGLLVLDTKGMVPSDLISESDKVTNKAFRHAFTSSDVTAGNLSISTYGCPVSISDDSGVTYPLQFGTATIAEDSGSVVIDMASNLAAIGKEVTGTWYVNFASGGKETPAGVSITEHTESSFDPVDGAIYRHTIVAGETIELETANLTADRCATFELWLTMGATVVSFSLPDNLVWVSSAPSLDNINTLYALVIRWDGSGFVANLAYSKEVTA